MDVKLSVHLRGGNDDRLSDASIIKWSPLLALAVIQGLSLRARQWKKNIVTLIHFFTVTCQKLEYIIIYCFLKESLIASKFQYVLKRKLINLLT